MRSVFLPEVINHLLQYFDRGSNCLSLHVCLFSETGSKS